MWEEFQIWWCFDSDSHLFTTPELFPYLEGPPTLTPSNFVCLVSDEGSNIKLCVQVIHEDTKNSITGAPFHSHTQLTVQGKIHKAKNIVTIKEGCTDRSNLEELWIDKNFIG